MKNDLLNIVTPCCRPKNLLNIAASIKTKLNCPYHWFVVFDSKLTEDPASIIFLEYIKARVKNFRVKVSFYSNSSKARVGHGHRNFILDLIKDQSGWIYFNDDDNILSPDFASLDFTKTDHDAIVLSQNNADGSLRYNGDIPLLAEPYNMKTYHIDTAQLIYNLRCVREQRFKEEFYEADGMFAEEFYSKHKKVLFLKNKFCYYNFLEV
jgi:hypothetical protein|tara:strand:+ start:25 stop:651 length:627 start_codon:yes stop_codon:yes gene_type:complete